MNNQQKLIILAAIAGVSAVGLLLLLSRRRSGEEEDDNGGESLREFPDITAGETSASASDTVVRFSVPLYCVGAIIGKGGENIRQLKKETGARFDFEKETADSIPGEKKDRILEIRGEREKVRDAVERVKKFIADTPPVETEVILVPQTAVGRIIGRMGQTIKELSSISGARINVQSSSDRSLEGSQKVTLTGSAQQIEYAKGLIVEKVEEDRLSRLRRDPENVTVRRRSQSPSFKPKLSTVNLPKTDGFFPLFVSAFDVPGHFYIQLVTKESSKLDALTKEITDFFWDNNETGSQRLLDKVCVGDMVCAPFEHDNLWYRATVTEVNEEAKVAMLYYIDYGDTGDVPFGDLRRPKPEHLELDAQAIECFLANVEPKDGQWTDESIDRFEDLSYCAKWTQLMGRKVGCRETEDGRLPCLELVDTNMAEDVNIGEQLVKDGFALKTNESQASKEKQLTAIKEDIVIENANNNTPEMTSSTSILPEVTEASDDLECVASDLIKNSVVVSEEISSENVVLDEVAVSVEAPLESEVSCVSDDSVELFAEGVDPGKTDNYNALSRNSLTSLSSVSTEDTVIHVVDKIDAEVAQDAGQDKPELEVIVEANGEKSQDGSGPEVTADCVKTTGLEENVERNDGPPQGLRSDKDKVELHGVKGQSSSLEGTMSSGFVQSRGDLDSKSQDDEEIAERSEGEGQDSKDSGVDLDLVGLDSNAHTTVNDQVTRWMERSFEGSNQLETINENLPLDEEVKSSLQSADLESSLKAGHDGQHFKFQESMERAKENPIILSDDEDSMSYFSARSELTIQSSADTDTDTMSFKSAPDTPTNMSEFDFPGRGDSMIDYEVITTPIGSDDEQLISDVDATPVARTSSPKVPISGSASKTPKYQIRVIDESKDKGQSPKSVSLSMDNVTSPDMHTLSSSPQRLGKLSASMPHFGGLKTSESRFGGSGNLQGKETSI